MIKKIFESVIEVTGISQTQIRSQHRKGAISEARGIFYHVCDMVGINAKYSSAYIGKDRTSAIYLIDKHKFEYENDKELRDKTNRILNDIGYKDIKQEVKKPPEVSFKPIFNDEFKIVDASSRFFGTCFVGLVGKEVVTYGDRLKVINAMLDYNQKRI